MRVGVSSTGAPGQPDPCVTWAAAVGVPDVRGVLKVNPWGSLTLQSIRLSWREGPLPLQVQVVSSCCCLQPLWLSRDSPAPDRDQYQPFA